MSIAQALWEPRFTQGILLQDIFIVYIYSIIYFTTLTLTTREESVLYAHMVTSMPLTIIMLPNESCLYCALCWNGFNSIQGNYKFDQAAFLRSQLRITNNGQYHFSMHCGMQKQLSIFLTHGWQVIMMSLKSLAMGIFVCFYFYCDQCI